MENYFGTCKACQKKISVEANSCPQCGIPDPLNRLEHRRLCKIGEKYIAIAKVFGGLFGFGMLAVILMLFGVFHVSPTGWVLIGLFLITAIVLLIIAFKSDKQADEYFEANVRKYLDK